MADVIAIVVNVITTICSWNVLPWQLMLLLPITN